MTRYRNAVPQIDEGLFLTDGGIETTLIYLDGLDLPYFAAFDLLKTAEGTAALERYFRSYADLAARFDAGLILESATWRANPDWAERLGYTPDELRAAQVRSIEMLVALRASITSGRPVVISGCIGPRGDGYVPTAVMGADAARVYHAAQVATFAATDADLVTAITMNYPDEAIGIALAARDAEIPAVISFTVETDGALPTGQKLGEAIAAVDDATGDYPAYYMINCAHPTHFADAVAGGEAWTTRIRGVRANASTKSHAELDEATELDAGDPADLGARYAALLERLPLNVLGGCCGTDVRHIEQVALACAPAFRD